MSAVQQLDDGALVAQMICGVRAAEGVAWTEFLHRHERTIRKQIRKAGKSLSSGAQNELFSDVLARLHDHNSRRLCQYDADRGKLDGWVKMIAWQTVIDYLRALSAKRRRVAALQCEMSDDGPPTRTTAVVAFDGESKHETAPIQFMDRDAAMRWGLSELVALREEDKRRAGRARATGRDHHRSRDLKTGFGGAGAPIREMDNALTRARPPTDEYRRTGFARELANAIAADHAAHGPTLYNGQRLHAIAFLAWRVYLLCCAGAGSKPLGSVDSAWLLSAVHLSDNERGLVIAAADIARKRGIIAAQIDAPIATQLLTEARSKPADARQRLGRLLRSGFKDPREWLSLDHGSEARVAVLQRQQDPTTCPPLGCIDQHVSAQSN